MDDGLGKNKKYVIRKNADGEEELVYVADAEEDLTAEAEEEDKGGVAEAENKAEAAEERVEKKPVAERKIKAVEDGLAAAAEYLQAGDFENAEKAVTAALNADPQCGEGYVLKMRVLTKDFTDFTRGEECLKTAQYVINFCTHEQRAELKELAAPLKELTERQEEHAAALHVEVEQKKAERRELFVQKRKKWTLAFGLTLLPFVVCLIFAVAFGSVMYARKDGLNIIITIVFAALAALFFIATAFTAHKMWDAMKKVSLNEKNSSTALGREYEELKSQISQLNDIYNSFV